MEAETKQLIPREKSGDDTGGRGPFAMLAFGYASMRKDSQPGIQSLGKSRILPECPARTLVRHPEQKRERGIGKRQRGRVRNRSRHVGHAVVNDSVDGKTWIGVRGGPGRLHASALVDRHVYDDRA